jgi:hypothetical protein
VHFEIEANSGFVTCPSTRGLATPIFDKLARAISASACRSDKCYGVSLWPLPNGLYNIALGVAFEVHPGVLVAEEEFILACRVRILKKGVRTPMLVELHILQQQILGEGDALTLLGGSN